MHLDPYGFLDHHFESAVEDDIEDLVDEGVDLMMLECELMSMTRTREKRWWWRGSCWIGFMGRRMLC
ncbi:hypothetical protein L208DRAFT_1389388, partial [Tricholoma matsutake]